MLYLNGQPVSVTMFPDNTSQVWKLPEDLLIPKTGVALIEWRFSSESEFMHLAQLKDLLDEYGTEYGVISKLKIYYLPYGRQDKSISKNTTFALYTFADLLNTLDFHEVEIVDPHSHVALDWIRNSFATYPKDQIHTIMLATNTTIACYPDKGAVTKYTKVYNDLVGDAYIYGEKIRDQLTGNITSYKIIGEAYGENVLIIDDICDGGATFKLLAKDLLAAGANSVVLFVTHGIFSKGVRTLFESGIQRIFTQDGEVSSRHGSFHI